MGGYKPENLQFITSKESRKNQRQVDVIYALKDGQKIPSWRVIKGGRIRSVVRGLSTKCISCARGDRNRMVAAANRAKSTTIQS